MNYTEKALRAWGDARGRALRDPDARWHYMGFVVHVSYGEPQSISDLSKKRNVTYLVKRETNHD